MYNIRQYWTEGFLQRGRLASGSKKSAPYKSSVPTTARNPFGNLFILPTCPWIYPFKAVGDPSAERLA